MAKVMLMSLGSRDDMEPFLAKAEELLEEGHEVALCMPEQFKGLASEVSATWFEMNRAFLDLIESPEVQKCKYLLDETDPLTEGRARLFRRQHQARRRDRHPCGERKKGGQDPRQRPVHLERLTTFQLPPLSRIGILDTRRRCQMAPPLRIHPM